VSVQDYKVLMNIISDAILIQELDELPLAELRRILIKKYTNIWKSRYVIRGCNA
jgi:hypothetical protein